MNEIKRNWLNCEDRCLLDGDTLLDFLDALEDYCIALKEPPGAG